jgi:MoxR-like ATPase
VIAEGSGVKAHDTILPPIATDEVIVEMGSPARCTWDATINDYVSRLVEATRPATEVCPAQACGGSALIRTSKVLAAANGRHYVIPDDVKALWS